jgi:WD40 repeat protein
MPDNTHHAPASASSTVTPAGAAHLLFLSHAGVDSEAALRLAKRLEESEEARAHGLTVWIDKADLRAGSRWKAALQSALASSTAFAVYVGSRGVVNWVWDEVSVALDRAHRETRYPLVPVLAPGMTSADLPSFLSQYQGVGDPERPDEFRMLLRAVVRLDARDRVALEGDPFVGLRAYDSTKAHLFFGREQETEELVALLRRTPFVLVTGDSGSGKSSLVLAGLVPAFRGGRLGKPREEGPDETVWHVVETRPGTDPFGRLADSVRDAAERTGTGAAKASDLADLVRTRQPDKVRDAVLSGAPKDPARQSKVLVVVDQFEEFRVSPQAGVYASALLRLATPGDDRVRVVLTMRRDYLYACDSFPDLKERLQNSKPAARYLLHRMSREGLHAAITKPLDLAGIDERDREDLARAVLRDVGDEPGELALLQMALWRTWSETRGRGPGLVRAYGTIGRVEGALAQAAEDVFARLSPDEQRRAEALFVRLVRPGEAGGATRRVARLEEFDPPSRALADELSKEEQWRLLTMREDTVEIAHEQLATQWLRYQRWIANLPGDPEHSIPADPRGDDLRLLQSLLADAARWDAARSGEKVQSLATGADLELYQQLADRRVTWLSDIERRYVAASVDADLEEKKRRQDARDERERLLRERSAAAIRYGRMGSVAAFVAILAFALAGVAFWYWNRSAAAEKSALEARDIALSNYRTILAEGMRLTDPTVALKLAMGAGSLHDSEVNRQLVEKLYRDEVFYEHLMVHPKPVLAVAVSPTGQLIATGGEDGILRLWSMQGALLKTFEGRGGHINSIAFSRDGSLIATGFGGYDRQSQKMLDPALRVWTVHGDKRVDVGTGSSHQVTGVAFSPDGKTLLTAEGESGKAVLRNLIGEPVQTIALDHYGGASSAAFSPDGQSVFVGYYYHRACWWTLTGSLIEPCAKVPGSVTAVAFSPDGSLRMAAVGRPVVDEPADGPPNAAYIWDKTGKEVAILKGHEGPVLGAAFSPDGQTVATASGDSSLRLWNLGGQELQRLRGHVGRVTSVAFTPSGDAIVSGSGHYSKGFTVLGLPGWEEPNGVSELTGLSDHTARFWRLPTRLVARVHLPLDKELQGIAFSPDGSRIATRSNSGDTQLWDRSGALVRSYPNLGGRGTRGNEAAFSPDGKRIAVDVGSRLALFAVDGDLSQLTDRCDDGYATINGIQFSPDGTRLLSASGSIQAGSHEVCIWDTQGRLMQRIEGERPVDSAAMSPDNQRVIAIGYDNVIHIYTGSGQELSRFPNYLSDNKLEDSGSFMKVVFAQDGGSFATSGADGQARVWSSTGDLLAVLGKHKKRIVSLSMSADGRYLLTGSLGARLWDRDGRCLHIFDESRVGIAVSFSTQQEVMIGYLDNMVEVWSMKEPMERVIQRVNAQPLDAAHQLALGLTTPEALLRSDDPQLLMDGLRFASHRTRFVRGQEAKRELERNIERFGARLLSLVARDSDGAKAWKSFFKQSAMDYLRGKRSVEAIALAYDAWSLDPKDEEVRTILALSYALGGKVEEHERFFAGLADRDPKQNEELLAMLRSLGDGVSRDSLERITKIVSLPQPAK